MRFKNLYKSNLRWNPTTKLELIIQYRLGTRTRYLTVEDVLEYYGNYQVESFKDDTIVIHA